MNQCKVCGDAIVIMINRGSGVCTENCRLILMFNPEPPVEHGGDAYDEWVTKVRELKRRVMDGERVDTVAKG